MSDVSSHVVTSTLLLLRQELHCAGRKQRNDISRLRTKQSHSTYMVESSGYTHVDSSNVLYQLTGNKTGKCVEDLYCLSPLGMCIRLKNHCKILYLKYK
jgi:hypothetical protein